jgi:hypothetical protein
VEYTYVIVSAHLPAHPAANVGVLLLDESRDQLHFRFRADFESVAGPDDATVLRDIPETLAQIAAEEGAAAMLSYLEGICSNAIRISERFAVEATGAEEALEQIYSVHVGR